MEAFDSQIMQMTESVCVCVGAVSVCGGGRDRVCQFCWQGAAVHFCSSNTEFTNAVRVIDDHEILQTCHQSPKVPFYLTFESDRVTRRPYDPSVKAHVCARVCVAHLKTGRGHDGWRRLGSGCVGVSSGSWTGGHDVQMRRLRRFNGQLVVAGQFWGRHISPRAWGKRQIRSPIKTLKSGHLNGSFLQIGESGFERVR